MNTDNKSDDLMGILDEFYIEAQGNTGYDKERELVIKEEIFTEAHSQIKALFMDCLPKKLEILSAWEVLRPDTASQYKAVNDCIDQAKTNFNKRLGRK